MTLPPHQACINSPFTALHGLLKTNQIRYSSQVKLFESPFHVKSRTLLQYLSEADGRVDICCHQTEERVWYFLHQKHLFSAFIFPLPQVISRKPYAVFSFQRRGSASSSTQRLFCWSYRCTGGWWNKRRMWNSASFLSIHCVLMWHHPRLFKGASSYSMTHRHNCYFFSILYFSCTCFVTCDTIADAFQGHTNGITDSESLNLYSGCYCFFFLQVWHFPISIILLSQFHSLTRDPTVMQ